MGLADTMNPIVRIRGVTEKDEIHRRRMEHATCGMLSELISLGIPDIGRVFCRWGVLVGCGEDGIPFFTIDYADGFKQILVKAKEPPKAVEVEKKKKSRTGGKVRK